MGRATATVVVPADDPTTSVRCVERMRPTRSARDTVVVLIGHGSPAPAGLASSVRVAPLEADESTADAVARDADTRLSRWRVRPVGDGELVRLRRFARSTRAVVPLEGPLARVVAGSLVDLGEGGIRARFDAQSPLTEEAAVQVHLNLRDHSVVLVGTVLRCLPMIVDGVRGYEAVIVFDASAQQRT